MYVANEKRYDKMKYNRCGKSGLMLPAVSLGLWHNFGDNAAYSNIEQMCFTAFDNGITHFDLANNYGPKAGSAEENFGRIMKEHFRPYRDEMVISTKAGYYMWAGPYGDWGSRKYLISSLDQSLKRMGLDYVDIFYHHRMDPNTPLEETMGALDQIVRSGKALYVLKERRLFLTSFTPRSSSIRTAITYLIVQSSATVSRRHPEISTRASSASRLWRRAGLPTGISTAFPQTAVYAPTADSCTKIRCREITLKR